MSFFFHFFSSVFIRIFTSLGSSGYFLDIVDGPILSKLVTFRVSFNFRFRIDLLIYSVHFHSFSFPCLLSIRLPGEAKWLLFTLHQKRFKQRSNNSKQQIISHHAPSHAKEHEQARTLKYAYGMYRFHNT